MQKIRSGNENDRKTRTGSYTQFLVGPAQTLQEPFLKGASPGPLLHCQVGSRQGFFLFSLHSGLQKAGSMSSEANTISNEANPGSDSLSLEGPTAL